MTPFDCGDVVLVPFPFTSQTASKKRPGVVVSGAAYDRERPGLVLMAITSQLRSSQAFGEVWIEGWRPAGLLKPSAIKPVIATLEKGLVLRRLGVLQSTDQNALREALGRIIG